MKIKQAFWFSTMVGTIGIVVGEDEHTGKREGYIGIVVGSDEERDTEIIAEQGSPVIPAYIGEIADYLRGGK